MSYMMQFPPALFPPKIRSKPYVMFAILGADVSNSLPPNIPAAMVLHFIPKMQEWMLPPPNPDLNSICPQYILSQFVCIDIQVNIHTEALKWIINRMLTLSGLPQPASTFNIQPGLATSIFILHAWSAFELPTQGVQALRTHLFYTISLCPVTHAEIKLLAQNMSDESAIICEMIHNVCRNWESGEYSTYGKQLISSVIKEDEVLTNLTARIQATYGIDILMEKTITEAHVGIISSKNGNRIGTSLLYIDHLEWRS
jgi:hypothetical protein